MNITSHELGDLIGSYLWPFIRIAALLMVVPIFSSVSVPARIRIGIAFILTLAIAPILQSAPKIDPVSLEGVLTTMQQILIGVVMGFALKMVFEAFLIGAHIVATQMGLGFASMVDPQNGVQSPVLGLLFTLMVTLIFLVLNGHLFMIQWVVKSFQTIPVGMTGLPQDSYWRLVAWMKEVLGYAVWIALPGIAALMSVNITFGVISRAAPQFNLFVVGLPLSIAAGFFVLTLTVPNMVDQFMHILQAGDDLIDRLISP